MSTKVEDQGSRLQFSLLKESDLRQFVDIVVIPKRPHSVRNFEAQWNSTVDMLDDLWIEVSDGQLVSEKPESANDRSRQAAKRST
jgi:hypothetical protein